MDGTRFDRLARAFVATPTRRATLGLGAAGLLGILGPNNAGGKKKKGKKKKCKKCGPCATCKKGKCKPKNAGTPCGEGKQCFANGECVACDVCLGDCPFTSLLDASLQASDGARIQLCPGKFPTNVLIDRSLTVIGAGSGKGGTVLDGQGRDLVLAVGPFISDTDAIAFDMRHLTVTGGKGGILCLLSTVTLEDVHIAGNETTGFGGGITAQGSLVTLVESRVTANSANKGGGIAIFGGTLRLTAGSTVTDNTAATSGGAGGIYNHIDQIDQIGTVEILGGSSVTGNTMPNCTGTTAC